MRRRDWVLVAFGDPYAKGQRSLAPGSCRLVPASLQRLRLLEGFLDRADHVERLLGQLIAFAVDDHVEALDRVLQRHVLARRAGEHFRDAEGLRQEELELA